ncbi:MAG TPA: metallophosphoesterase family protein [Thermomicrobiales bacterium]|nr:metallophosphoesterase family protein [Thermomicrobiales bacterium]
MMRVAVMSDIHGFSLALDTVLTDLDALPPVDEIVVAGDLCQVGPAPRDVIEILRSRKMAVLQGNTDAYLVEAADGRARAEQAFALDQIGEAGVEYLAGLPFERRITPPGGTSPDDDLLVVHANPHDLEQKLTLEMRDRELGNVIGDTRAAVIAFGHHHVSFTRQFGDMLLVDVSAVGNPKDGDLRCKYAIFTWDDSSRRWSVEQRKLPYPLAETTAQILGSGLPDPEKTLATLKRASY